MQVNSHSSDQKSGEIWAGQADLQPISFKSDRLLGKALMQILDDIGGLVHPLAIALFIRDFQAGYLDLAAALQ
jgi:hypothetical protein